MASETETDFPMIDEIGQQINELGISKVSIKYDKPWYRLMVYNSSYDSPMTECTFIRSSLKLTMEKLRTALWRNHIEEKTVTKLIALLTDAWIQAVKNGKLEDRDDDNGEKNHSSNSNNSNKEAWQRRKQKEFIRKYTGNGTLSIHESIVIVGQPSTFLCLTDKHKPLYVSEIELTNKILYPADTIDTQNPLPYVFQSTAELEKYLELARKETFETLYSKVESIFKKYVNAEEYYITVLAADIIYSYFQDKFPTTHYNIFVGDNGSGKNSVLLVFKYLGYRVFYVVSASAPNYFTFLGDVEECQGSIAEDEAEAIGYEIDKQKVIKTGYCSGGTVPKVDLTQGRTQDCWLTYCHKWFAMEELPEHKKIKGILDRSFVYNFVVGNVPYNIKDVMKYAGDAEFKLLHDELMDTKKLLLAFRMVHYNDVIPNIKLNIIHRNEELAKPLLRLFSYKDNSPIALDKIRLALSKFILGRNESKRNSIESKLLETIRNLIKRREEYKDTHEGQECEGFKGLQASPYSFYNEQIWAELKDLMDGKEIPGKSESFYSTEYGAITHKRVTGLYKSKLKANSFLIRVDDKVNRGLMFTKDVLDRLDSYYNVPDEITTEGEPVTHVTDVTDYRIRKRSNNHTSENEDTQNRAQNDDLEGNLSENNTTKDPLTGHKSVTSVTENQSI